MSWTLIDNWWTAPTGKRLRAISGGQNLGDFEDVSSLETTDILPDSNYPLPSFDPRLAIPSGGLLDPSRGGAPVGAGNAQSNQPGVWGSLPIWAQLAMLGLGGAGLAGAGQQLFGGAPTSRTTTSSPYASTLLNAYLGQQGVMAPFQNQLYGQGAGLLGSLATGQFPPGFERLIEQAFQPQMGDLYSQATEQGRRRGFYDAPATSPPGGAILGPGLANLQGQMAQAKLQSVLPFANALMAPGQFGAQTGASALRAAPALGQTQVAQGPQPTLLQTIGQLGPIIKGIGDLAGIFNTPQRGIGLSGTYAS